MHHLSSCAPSHAGKRDRSARRSRQVVMQLERVHQNIGGAHAVRRGVLVAIMRLAPEVVQMPDKLIDSSLEVWVVIGRIGEPAVRFHRYAECSQRSLILGRRASRYGDRRRDAYYRRRSRSRRRLRGETQSSGRIAATCQVDSRTMSVSHYLKIV